MKKCNGMKTLAVNLMKSKAEVVWRNRVTFWPGNETHSQQRQIGALLQEDGDREADEI